MIHFPEKAAESPLKCWPLTPFHSACGSVRYCTRECQLQHWDEHKAACKIIKKEKKAREEQDAARVQEALASLEKLGVSEDTLVDEQDDDEDEDGPEDDDQVENAVYHDDSITEKSGSSAER